VNIQNLQGYCLIYRDAKEIPAGLSSATSAQRWEQWQSLTPLVIYPTPQALIEAVPDFDKKKHIIGQVIVHLIGERVEVVSIPDKV
jgi:hypothetical protein